MKTPLPKRLKYTMIGAIVIFFYALTAFWFVVLDQGTKPLSFIFTDALSIAVSIFFALAGVMPVFIAWMLIRSHRWRERNRLKESIRTWRIFG